MSEAKRIEVYDVRAWCGSWLVVEVWEVPIAFAPCWAGYYVRYLAGEAWEARRGLSEAPHRDAWRRTEVHATPSQAMATALRNAFADETADYPVEVVARGDASIGEAADAIRRGTHELACSNGAMERGRAQVIEATARAITAEAEAQALRAILDAAKRNLPRKALN